MRGQCRRGNARNRGPSGMEPLGPRALLKKHLHPRGGAGRDPLRRYQRRDIERHQPPGGQRAGEMSNDAGGVEPSMMKSALCCGADADSGLHANAVGGH